MHLLPRVAELERRFADVLVVVGVHAGKFVEERRTDNIREACARLGVHHPVLNDRKYRTWRSYAVQAWPTVVLLSPDGYVIGSQAGEFEVEPMAEAVSAEVERYEAAGLLSRAPLELGSDPVTVASPSGVLRYPTRAVRAGEMLYVSDTGNARVLELRMESPVRAAVTRAFGEGLFAEPQGLATGDGVLYVADRRAHSVFAVSRDDGAVRRVAGTGELGGYRIPEGAPAARTALRSPWGLALDGDTLHIAMAGSHQLWSLDTASAEPALTLVAGAGGENIGDGPALSATLAQPSGLALGGGMLWFADAESSAVRSVTAGADVETAVGTGLFQFGDRDGTGDGALLQHDLDLAALPDGSLIVADTYNSKLKRLDPRTRRCEALPGEAGSGEALWEPSGVHADGDAVVVADTNHHRLVRVDVASGAVEEIAVEG